MTSSDFWSLTPRRFAAIVHSRAAQVDVENAAADRRAALIAAVIANQARGKGRAPYRIKDFMPRRHTEAPRGRRQTVEEMQAIMRLWAAVTAAEA